MNNEISSPMSWDELFMRHVYLIASKSKDIRTKIGAILVKDGVIISEGYNGFPRGVKDLEERYKDRETKYKFMEHGELNSVLNAVRHGMNTSGSTCFTQSIPCNECCKALIQAGIIRIVIHANYPSLGPKWEESIKWTKIMCEEADIPINKFRGTLDVKAWCDGKIIQV